MYVQLSVLCVQLCGQISARLLAVGGELQCKMAACFCPSVEDGPQQAKGFSWYPLSPFFTLLSKFIRQPRSQAAQKCWLPWSSLRYLESGHICEGNTGNHESLLHTPCVRPGAVCSSQAACKLGDRRSHGLRPRELFWAP